MRIYSKTDIGKARHSNQDAYFAGELENGAVFGIVCDGMGGANAGNIASTTAVKLISEYILRSYRLSMDEFEQMYSAEKRADALHYAKDLKDRYTVLWLYEQVK